LSEFGWLRKTTRVLSKMKKRDAEKHKRQRKQRKAVNHLHNCEHSRKDIANSSMDAKGVLLSTIEPHCLQGVEISNCSTQLQLGRISIFRAYTTLLVACIRFGETMSTTGYGSGLFD